MSATMILTATVPDDWKLTASKAARNRLRWAGYYDAIAGRPAIHSDSIAYVRGYTEGEKRRNRNSKGT